MPGRTPREAVHAYIEPIQQSLSCITRKVLKPNGYGDQGKECVLTFADGPTIPIGRDLHFRFVQQFIVVPLPEDPKIQKVQTTYYSYAIEDENAEEILGYHWHPNSVSRINYCHLHLGNGAKVGRKELESTKAHLPTGRVGIEEVIHLLIETFEIKAERDDWVAVLGKNLKKFFKFASWGNRPE